MRVRRVVLAAPALPVAAALWFAWTVARDGSRAAWKLCRWALVRYADRSRYGAHTRYYRRAARVRSHRLRDAAEALRRILA